MSGDDEIKLKDLLEVISENTTSNQRVIDALDDLKGILVTEVSTIQELVTAASNHDLKFDNSRKAMEDIFNIIKGGLEQTGKVIPRLEALEKCIGELEVAVIQSKENPEITKMMKWIIYILLAANVILSGANVIHYLKLFGG